MANSQAINYERNRYILFIKFERRGYIFIQKNDKRINNPLSQKYYPLMFQLS